MQTLFHTVVSVACLSSPELAATTSLYTVIVVAADHRVDCWLLSLALSRSSEA